MTLDQLINKLTQLSDEIGGNTPVYITDSDFIEVAQPVRLFRVGRLNDPRTYDEDLTKPRGVIFCV